MANLNSIADLSTTPASNTNWRGQSLIGSVQLVKNLDEAERNISAMLKAFYDSLGGVATVSGTNTLTVTITEDWAAYASGLILAIKVANANTGAATLNVTVPSAGALGAKAIRKISGGTDVALTAGDLPQGARVSLVYDAAANSAAGAWILSSSSVSSATTSAQGIVELATVAEALAGTDAVRAVTPAGLYYPTGHLFGLTLSNNVSDATNDIDIAVGTCRSSDDTANMALASALTKQLDVAWAVGTNAGMLATGVAIANATYHIFLIKRPDTGVVDVAADTSVTGANIATNTNAAYTLKRRIGSIVRTGAAIKAFSQNGDEFLWNAAVLDINASNPGTSAVSRTLTVPIGIVVDAVVNWIASNTSSGVNFTGYVSSLAISDQSPSVGGASGVNLGGNVATTSGGASIMSGQQRTRTNTSGQVRTRFISSDANCTLYGSTVGWIDTRGRAA